MDAVSPRATAPTTARSFSKMGIVTLIVVAALALSFFLGRYPSPYITAPNEFFENDLARKVMLGIRLPRILIAFYLGMVLATAGAVFQMVFRNPLVDSGFLGVSGGAAFGASLAMVFFGGQIWCVQSGAIFFACLGLSASYLLGRCFRFGDWVLRLILAGIAVTAIFTSATGMIKAVADPLDQLPEITFWLLGGLWGITWSDTIHVLVVTTPCLFVIHCMRWRLNLLAMPDDTAFSLTAAPGKERLIMLVAAVISTAVVVSKAGQIQWVGLIIPHVARRLVGSDAQKVVPCSLLLGGVFVLVCDNVSRVAVTGEIPLGVLTAFSGALGFIVLMLRPQVFKKEP